MMLHLDISLWALLFWCAVFFAAAVGVVLICFCVLVDAFRIRFPLPASAVEGVELQPATEVRVVEYVTAARVEDPLPAASGPVGFGDAAIFDRIAMPLPPRRDDLAEFDFWGHGPRWQAKTGAYPVLDDGFVGRERFATRSGELLVTVDVGGDVRAELVAS